MQYSLCAEADNQESILGFSYYISHFIREGPLSIYEDIWWQKLR